MSSTTYYYANGAYYTAVPAGGYQVVAAPVGVTVVNPPAQVVNVTVNENKLRLCQWDLLRRESAGRRGRRTDL